MKSKTFTFLRIIPIITLLAFGCSKEEEVPLLQNNILLDGNAFSVTSASILGVAIGTDGHAGISLISLNGSSVETLTLDVEYSGNSSVEGTYSFPQAANDKYLDDFLSNFTVSNGTSFDMIQLLEGTVTVVKNEGNNYTVTMDVTMENGTIFKGVYRGEFTVLYNNG